MSQKKNSFVGGVAILSVLGIVTKLIGIYFQVPITNILGLEGQGIFQSVYLSYILLMTIATSGIPVAISRLVAESVTLHRPREARALLRTAMILLVSISAVLTVLLIALADPVARLASDASAAAGYRMIAPTILIVAVMSAFRGYLQGRSQMVPTAVSQLIEQLGRVFIAVPLAVIGVKQGIAAGAAYALAGVTISEVIALCYVAAVYWWKRRGTIRDEAEDQSPPSSFSVLARRMIRIAVPIIVGSIIVPFALNIDTYMVKGLLVSIGFSTAEMNTRYGALSGPVSTMINVPSVFASAICIGLVPLISSARVQGNKEEISRSSLLGMRLGSVIGLPCAIGMSMLATPIIHLLYGLTGDELTLTGSLLSISALTVFFFTMVQATTGILQGAGLQQVPMISLVAGVACKIGMNYLLVRIPSLNIFGAPFSSILCYFISMSINMVWILRKVHVKMNWGDVLLRPGAAVAGMAAAVFLMTRVLDMNRKLFVVLVIGIAALLYVALVFALGVLRREDMAQVPGGRKIEKLMLKLRVWR